VYYKLYPDGNYSLGPNFDQRINKEALISVTPWFHEAIRHEGYDRLLKDPRSKFLLENDGTLEGVIAKLGDLLYIPMPLANDFCRVAQLMVENNVHLECSIGKIARSLYKLFNATVNERPLCTDYGENIRGENKMIEKCWKGSPLSAIHPFKISKDTRGWNEKFEWATTGKSTYVPHAITPTISRREL
jgi:hypothetical protein